MDYIIEGRSMIWSTLNPLSIDCLGSGKYFDRMNTFIESVPDNCFMTLRISKAVKRLKKNVMLLWTKKTLLLVTFVALCVLQIL